MSIELRSIVDKGNLSKERLTFRVNSNSDIGDYVILQSGFADGEVTTDIHNAFWFSYKPVKKGDLIVLYTRSGSGSVKPLKQSGFAHFYYWGLNSAMWENSERAAVVLYAPKWEAKCVNDLVR